MSKFDFFNDEHIEAQSVDSISYELVHTLYEEEFTRIEMYDIRVADVVINEKAREHVMKLPEFLKGSNPRALSRGIIGKLSNVTVWLSDQAKGPLKAYPSHSTPNLISTLDIDFPAIWIIKHELGI